MVGKQPFEIVFGSGVARFDSVGNLFVNLPHSDDDPMQVRLADDRVVSVPERRARVHAAGEPGPAQGVFPASADLPRGLTVELKGYLGATFDAGRLVVSVPADTSVPDWFEAGARHEFTRPGNALRLWVKSSMPSGVSLANASSVDSGPPTQPKPVARAQFQPVSSTEPVASAPEPAPAPDAEAPTAGSSGPYRPDRLAAGHLGVGSDKPSRGLGCSTLAMAVALAVLSLVAFS